MKYVEDLAELVLRNEADRKNKIDQAAWAKDAAPQKIIGLSDELQMHARAFAQVAQVQIKIWVDEEQSKLVIAHEAYPTFSLQMDLPNRYTVRRGKPSDQMLHLKLQEPEGNIR